MKSKSKKIVVHNLIIVDESASMQSLKKATVDSVNDTIKAIRESQSEYELQDQRISLFTFNGLGVKMHFFDTDASISVGLRYDQFKPNSKTPLLDCLGQSIGMVKTSIEDQVNTKVIVTILTDGCENGSKKYCKKAIRELIGSMKKKGWIFNYIGANHDVKKACEELNISNYYVFKAFPKALQKQMYLERLARRHLYSEVIIQDDYKDTLAA